MNLNVSNLKSVVDDNVVIFENDDSVDVIKKLDEADDILYMHKREKRKSISR